MKTEVLKKIIKARIEGADTILSSRVSYIDSEPRGYPYATFEFDEYPETSHRIPVRLEVNVIDYGVNSQSVDELADKVQTAFDNYNYIDDDIQFISYKGSRNIIREEDKKIIRRRLLFELSLYERR